LILCAWLCNAFAVEDATKKSGYVAYALWEESADVLILLLHLFSQSHITMMLKWEQSQSAYFTSEAFLYHT
jgi:hypothetical protein